MTWGIFLPDYFETIGIVATFGFTLWFVTYGLELLYRRRGGRP